MLFLFFDVSSFGQSPSWFGLMGLRFQGGLFTDTTGGGVTNLEASQSPRPNEKVFFSPSFLVLSRGIDLDPDRDSLSLLLLSLSSVTWACRFARSRLLDLPLLSIFDLCIVSVVVAN